GEILRIDGVDRVAAEARNAEKGLHDQAADEEQRDHDDDAGENRDQGVFKHVPEQHARFRQPFRARGTHVILADLLEEKRPIEPRVSADTAHDADHDRQHDELESVDSAAVAGDRDEVQQLAREILPADDVKQRGHRHQYHADDDPDGVQVHAAKERQDQREGDVRQHADQEGGKRDRETRPHALADVIADVAAFIGAPEVEREQPQRMPIKNRVGHALQAGGLVVVHERFVVAALGLPLRDRFRRHALHAELYPRHVIRTVHEEKEREGEQVHSQQDGNGIEQAAYQVSEHLSLSVRLSLAA